MVKHINIASEPKASEHKAFKSKALSVVKKVFETKCKDKPRARVSSSHLIPTGSDLSDHFVINGDELMCRNLTLGNCPKNSSLQTESVFSDKLFNGIIATQFNHIFDLGLFEGNCCDEICDLANGDIIPLDPENWLPILQEENIFI